MTRWSIQIFKKPATPPAEKMATKVEESDYDVDISPLRREVSDHKFVNISIKCYEKRAGTGFKEEYYAYKIVAM